jgi:hypothetical protein
VRRYLTARKCLGAAVLALAVAGVFAGVGSATVGKQYSATISPLSAAAGVANTFQYTVKNLDAQQPLGSFRVSIPAGGWVVSGASVTVASSPPGKAWSVTPNTVSLGYIEAKASNNNARLAKDQSVVVAFTATAPCSGGPFVFQSAAHQANLFQGTNNEFTQANSDANRTVALLVGGGAVASVSIDSVGTPQTAGAPFDVTVRTFNACGNPTTGAASATLSGFHPSPSPSTPMFVAQPPSTSGGGSVATFSVTAYKAETAALTATVGTTSSLPTSDIEVVPGPLTLAFTKQPGAAKFDTPIPSASPPDPITVLAQDAYGNAAPNGTSVTMIAPSVLYGTLSATTVGGLAQYANLKIATVGIYQLVARLDASPVVTATSNPFAIANDLQNCTNVTLCTSTASNGKQSSTSKITTSSTTFQNIVLTTTFFDPSVSNCSGFTLVPGTNVTDVSIQSGNVAAAQPVFLVTLIIPKATLQAAGLTQRSADSFDACIGAKWLGTLADARVPWTTKTGTATGPDAEGFYWGLGADCSSLPSGSINPCVRLKTKNESELTGVIGSLPAGVTFTNSDLALVVRMGYPWDGRFGGG